MDQKLLAELICDEDICRWCDSVCIDEIFIAANAKNPTSKLSIALAVSGGPDSMFMAVLFKILEHKFQGRSFELSALIVDHKLRSESTEEAHAVQKYIQENMKINAHILTWQHGNKPEQGANNTRSNVHYYARQARYNLLTNYCTANNIGLLVTAHNKDDQSETILMRILRGSGIDGLCGIPQITTINKIKVMRPILSISRDAIDKFLAKYGIYHVHDPSNKDLKYDRAKARVLMQNIIDLKCIDNRALLLDRMELLGNNAQRSRNFIHQHVFSAMQQIAEISAFGAILVDLGLLQNLDVEIGLRLLRAVLQQVSGTEYPPRLKNIEHLWSNILYQNPFKKVTVGKCEVVLVRENARSKLLFTKEYEFISKDILPLEANIEILWDNRFYVKVKRAGYSVGLTSSSSAAMMKMVRNDQFIKKWEARASVLKTMPVIYDEDLKPRYGVDAIVVNNLNASECYIRVKKSLQQDIDVINLNSDYLSVR